MDQEGTMDFQTLRAKFQAEEFHLKQPRMKPALPEKPKVVPPPQSPPHYLPAGARPSLLTSINQSLEGKTLLAPRVVFKDDKKESKMPLIPSNSKGKDKSEEKVKAGKDKTKGSKEKMNNGSSDQKQKKEKDKGLPLLLSAAQKEKESTAELVQATPPPKAAAPKRKSLFGFKKAKKDSVDVPDESILDSPSSDVARAVPLIPVPSDFADTAEPEISAPKALMPIIPVSADSSAPKEITSPSTTPASPDLVSPSAFIPDIPAPIVPTSESETPLQTETPALPVSSYITENEIIPSPPSTTPTPPPSHNVSGTPPVASTPSPSPPEVEIAAQAGIESVIESEAALEQPPPSVIDPPTISSSPKATRPISALSALERAEDMNLGKRTTPADQRIFNALEKARKKSTSPMSNSTYSVTPPPEELPPSQSPTLSIPELPPIDYEDRAGRANSSKPQVNGTDHRQTSPALGGINEEGSGAVPELLVVPPPPPRHVHANPEVQDPTPEKLPRLDSANLNEFISTPLVENNDVPFPPDFSETDTTDVPKFDQVDSLTPVSRDSSEWGNGEYTGPDTPELHSNGITAPGVDVNAALPDENQHNLTAESTSLPVSQESPPVAGPGVKVDNGIYESSENIYEDVTASASKKKGKSDGGKKRKGPPKNPYVEASQETNEEKSKMGRFGKGDKKVSSEGPDEKELKKREKQRLEKEKKELKEKQEREKKEQKEREKKENEMKKKFKITGQEDAIYQGTVTVTTKGRKNDLAVKSGDTISIIRTTNCPKGKWLARDSSNNYGYVPVDNLELDIKEMLEMRNKAATSRKSSNNAVEAEVTSTGSRASNHYPISAESFEDDSDEWTGDEDDYGASPTVDAAYPLAQVSHTRTLSMPDMGNKDLSINHQHSHSDLADSSHIQARHEALQKLATFFHSPKPAEPESRSTELETSPVLVTEEAVEQPESSATQEVDFENPDMIILPPPDLYADFTVE